MEITQVKIFPVHEDKLKAFVSIVFDHCFMINDIKVIQGRDGLFLSMPSRRKKNGEFKDVAHPLNNETRKLVEEKVLAEYWSAVDDPTPRRPVSESSVIGATPVEPPRTGEPDSSDRDSTPDHNNVTTQTAPEPSPQAADDEGRTLEEVEEIHLRDSFWTVT